jgi:hypothetical protein
MDAVRLRKIPAKRKTMLRHSSPPSKAGVSLLTKDSGGEMWSSLGNRQGELKLHELPKTTLEHCQLEVFLILFLAAMAGREEEEQP